MFGPFFISFIFEVNKNRLGYNSLDGKRFVRVRLGKNHLIYHKKPLFSCAMMIHKIDYFLLKFCKIIFHSISGRNAAGAGTHYAYQGVEPIDGKDESQWVRHAYYQWVPFVLFLQGLMFYLPHYLWKTFEDRRLTKMTDGLRGRTLNLEQRKDQCEKLVKYVKETFHMNNTYAIVYFVCDILNFINTVGQMYFINLFLGGVFLTYGTDVLYWADTDPESRTDPLVEVFPRLAKCTFYKYGSSGTIGKFILFLHYICKYVIHLFTTCPREIHTMHVM